MGANGVQCPLCQGKVERGLLLDRGHATKLPAEWVAGTVEPSFVVGVQTHGKQRRGIRADRCTDCGYLLLFATEEPNTF